MASDPVLRPVSRGLGPNLQQLKGDQRVGDGQSSPGGGIPAVRAMTGMVDASTAGGLVEDTAGKFARFPQPIRGLLGKLTGANDNDTEVM